MLERGDISPECIVHTTLVPGAGSGMLLRKHTVTAAECQQLCQHHARSAVPVCAGWSFCADVELCATRYHACYLSGAGYKVSSIDGQGLAFRAGGCVTH